MVVVACIAALLFSSCAATKKGGTSKKSTSKKVKKGTSKKVIAYTNDVVCLWLRPVNINPDSVFAKTTYEVEGAKPLGAPVLVFVKGDILAKVLKLSYDSLGNKKFGSTIHGYMYTCNNLGQKSILTEEQINSDRYSEQQKETLRRDNHYEKYELRSFVPISVTGRIVGDEVTGGYKIVMNNDDSNNSVPIQNKEQPIKINGNQNSDQKPSTTIQKGNY